MKRQCHYNVITKLACWNLTSVIVVFFFPFHILVFNKMGKEISLHIIIFYPPLKWANQRKEVVFVKKTNEKKFYIKVCKKLQKLI